MTSDSNAVASHHGAALAEGSLSAQTSAPDRRPDARNISRAGNPLANPAERAERLQRLSAALSIASTQPEVASAIVEHATSAFGAAGTVIAQLNDAGTHVEILGVSDMPEDVLEEWYRFPLEAPVPLADATRRGATIFLESRERWFEKYPDMRLVVEHTRHHATMVLPLVVEGAAKGALGIAFEVPRTFSEDERALALAIAQQSALALARARLYDKEREARARADEANRVKTQFLATMSHELRTPLNAIAGYTDLIAMGVHGPVTPAQAKALDRIRQSELHLLSLINDVLNFARIDTGNVHLDLRSIPVEHVFADVEPMIATQIAAKGLAYNVSAQNDLLVTADAEKLRQILLNLLSNAVKFTGAGGSVTLRAKRQRDHVVITVSDSGIGVPPEKLERIFEPFVQLDRSLSSTHEGTGLGLAISRELARLMSGDIIASSMIGVGSTFTLTLPAASTNAD